MAEPDLNFIARQNERILIELRGLRGDVRALQSMREEFALLREQVRIQGGIIERLDDTIRHDVLDRLQQLESEPRGGEEPR
jgi:hypothetical protein